MLDILLLAIPVVAFLTIDGYERRQAIRNHSWQILYFLAEAGRVVSHDQLTIRFELTPRQTSAVMEHLEDCDLVIAADGRYRINFQGLQALLDNHEQLVGQPWYQGQLSH